MNGPDGLEERTAEFDEAAFKRDFERIFEEDYLPDEDGDLLDIALERLESFATVGM